VRRVTLGQLFGVATIAIAIVVAVAFALFERSSRAQILRASERQREVVAQRIGGRVVRELGRAREVLDNLDRGIRTGAVPLDDPARLEADLFMRVLDDKHIEEVTFTRATLAGYDAEGEAMLAPSPRWQLGIHCASTGSITTKLTRAEGDGFTTLVRERGPEASFATTPLRPAGAATDPTAHHTFSVIASKAQRGKATWSQLHWSELDRSAAEHRVVVSVQKTIEDAAGNLLGVLRVAILTSELDQIARARSDPADSEDVERVALLETERRSDAVHLVARVDPSDRVVSMDDELRIVSDHPPPEIAALFASPIVKGLDKQHPNRAGSFTVGGQPWLATLSEIQLGEGGTEGWMVAVLVPEARYTAELVGFERMFSIAFGSTLALVLAIGGLTIAAVRRGLGRVTSTTTRMRSFDFTPTADTSAIRDVDDVMQDLERAKTVVRAMGKYVPIDLVRRLYSTNRDPQLGGELADIALMFTDIEGFTPLSEKLPPDVLARRLGDYLEAMTTAIEKTGGTIDKYIGDAVMAMWGAPTPVDGHARRACRAALDCMVAARDLYESSAWKGLPALVTRFGLHEAKVMVGHFGAPTRLSYTALGDGVNLAARLEPLCKQYGVVILVSEAIAVDAKDDFVFRRIDRVAVKGKTTGIEVYELLGAAGDDIPHLPRARRYEEAFDAYLKRDFKNAIAVLEAQVDDPPSEVLLARCRELLTDPPPPEWTGIHHASSK